MHHSPRVPAPPSRPRQAPTHYTCCRVSQHFGSLLCGPSPSCTHSHALPSPSRRCPLLSHSRTPPSRTSGCALPPPTCTPSHTHSLAFLLHTLPPSRTLSPPPSHALLTSPLTHSLRPRTCTYLPHAHTSLLPSQAQPSPHATHLKSSPLPPLS